MTIHRILAPARERLPLAALTLALCVQLALPAAHAADDPHAGHAMKAGQTRSEQQFPLPAVKVTRADGKRMSLAEAVDDGRPVMLNFIYTSCNAICPVTSQVFVEFRERLGAARDKINMVSISIDPEQDTPRRLTAYAKRFGSAGTWAHYTSSAAEAVEIQRAFGAWRGDKMNHQPSTWLRISPGQPWVRYEGFTGPEQLVNEYLQLGQGLGAERCTEPGKPALSTTSPAGTLAGFTTKSKP